MLRAWGLRRCRAGRLGAGRSWGFLLRASNRGAAVGEDLLNHRQLGGQAGAHFVQRDGLVIGFVGQQGVHVAQVFVAGGVVGVNAHGLLQQAGGLHQVTLRGIEHGQVVIRLWQVGKVLDQRVKDLNGFRVIFLLGGDYTLRKAFAGLLKGRSLHLGGGRAGCRGLRHAGLLRGAGGSGRCIVCSVCQQRKTEQAGQRKCAKWLRRKASCARGGVVHKNFLSVVLSVSSEAGMPQTVKQWGGAACSVKTLLVTGSFVHRQILKFAFHSLGFWQR